MATCGNCGQPGIAPTGTCPTCETPGPKRAKEAALRAASQAGNPEIRRLQIKPNGLNPADVAAKVSAHLHAANKKTPSLFRMGDVAVLLRDDGTLEPFDQDAWLTYISERVNFQKDDETGFMAVSQAILRMTAKKTLRGLPDLDGVVSAPYLDAAGNVVQTAGYNPDTRLYLRPDGLRMPPIPDRPRADQVEAAVKTLRDWLCDFEFESEADRANALGEVLTLTGREMFPLVPLLVHDASTPGSGKGLLADLLSIVATGEVTQVMELPDDKDEVRKTILSILLSGRMIAVWDEMHSVKGTSLASILTAETYSARVLGASKMATVRNKMVQFALGNNVAVYGDLKRRVMPLRIVPSTATPEKRKDFVLPNIKEWTLEHRADLLSAAFILWRNWIVKGRPSADVTLGSFDRWAKAVGGALLAAGITGFASHTSAWLSYSEDEGDEWHGHFNALRLTFGGRWFTTQDVADAVAASRVPRPPVKIDPEKDLSTIIGYSYRNHRDRWRGEIRLVRSTERSAHGGRYEWRIESRAGSVLSDPKSSPPSPPCTPAQVSGLKRGGDAGVHGGDDSMSTTISPAISTTPHGTNAQVNGAFGGDGGDGGDNSGTYRTEGNGRGWPTTGLVVTGGDDWRSAPLPDYDQTADGWPVGSIGAAEDN